MIIDQLPVLGGDVVSTDEIPVERGTTVYKTTPDKFLAALPKDNSPTQGSSKVVTSGGVYTAVQAAQTAADNAQTAADNAQTAADNAQTAADNAQLTADEAIAKVLPAGGSAGNYLRKASDTDFDAEWVAQFNAIPAGTDTLAKFTAFMDSLVPTANGYAFSYVPSTNSSQIGIGNLGHYIMLIAYTTNFRICIAYASNGSAIRALAKSSGNWQTTWKSVALS